jgi:hypothetical protein
MKANTPLTRKLCPVTCGACGDYGKRLQKLLIGGGGGGGMHSRAFYLALLGGPAFHACQCEINEFLRRN